LKFCGRGGVRRPGLILPRRWRGIVVMFVLFWVYWIVGEGLI
jgi:hypothetical protein